MNRVVVLTVVVLAGCCSADVKWKRPIATQEPWDTTYLIDLSPDDVSIAQLDSHAVVLGERLENRSQVHGVVWPMLRTSPDLPEPDRYVDGADSGIFTGFALASNAFRYGATHSNEDMNRLLTTLRGVHILTHITGTPGVICRCAFPADRQTEFGYPEEWERRLPDGFVHQSSAIVPDPWGDTYPSMIYYTRATKDQLTGLIFGLAVAARILEDEALEEHAPEAIQAMSIIRDTAKDIQRHLIKYDWYIRDERGNNDTNADHVDGLLKLQLLCLVAYTSGSSWDMDNYLKEFDGTINCGIAEWFNRFGSYSQYYAFNLRVARSFTIWFLERDPEKKVRVSEYSKCAWWNYVAGHQSAWFSIAAKLMMDVTAAWKKSLQSLSLRPSRSWSSPYWGQNQEPGLLSALWNCTDAWVLPPHLRKPAEYFTWEKAPWDTGSFLDKEGLGERTGLGFLLPYWMAKYHQLLP